MSIKIEISTTAKKDIKKLPIEIKERVIAWVKSVEIIGLEATRQQGGSGLHDEPLKGTRKGQRSVRLNNAWRLIYSIENGEIKIVKVLTITKHDYR